MRLAPGGGGGSLRVNRGGGSMKVVRDARALEVAAATGGGSITLGAGSTNQLEHGPGVVRMLSAPDKEFIRSSTGVVRMVSAPLDREITGGGSFALPQPVQETTGSGSFVLPQPAQVYTPRLNATSFSVDS